VIAKLNFQQPIDFRVTRSIRNHSNMLTFLMHLSMLKQLFCFIICGTLLNNLWKLWYICHTIEQVWPTSVLESHSLKEFCSNLDKNSPACCFLVSLRLWLAVDVCLIRVGTKCRYNVGFGFVSRSTFLWVIVLLLSFLAPVWIFFPVTGWIIFVYVFC